MKIKKEITVYKWQDKLKHLKDNLERCGIKDEIISSFASYLYSAFKNKIPIILSGINSIQIAKSISYIFTGKDLSIIDCNLSLKNIYTNQIVIIKNFIYSDKINEISNILLKRNKFYLITSPHYEDLRILPIGFFNYALPIMLEFIVDKPYDDNIVCCNKSDNYINYISQSSNTFKNIDIIKNLMSKFKISKLMRWNYLKLFSEAYFIDNSLNLNSDLMVFILTYAYIVNNKEAIKDLLQVNRSNYLFSKDCEALLDSYFNDL